jgi:methylated-DNA-[protein]-cysteine S-methyltransferase
MLEAMFSRNGLKAITLGAKEKRNDTVALIEGTTDPRARQLESYLREYFSGKDPGMFPLPLDLSGTSDFQRKTYAELSFVGFGVTTTYSELADRMGSPGAARAVGTAVGKNPFLLVIPCHRVLARGKGERPSLGGFGAGPEVKRELLALEGHGKDISGM